MTRKAILVKIVKIQKINCSFSNLYVSNYIFGRFAIYSPYSISSLVLEQQNQSIDQLQKWDYYKVTVFSNEVEPWDEANQLLYFKTLIILLYKVMVWSQESFCSKIVWENFDFLEKSFYWPILIWMWFRNVISLS